MDHWMDEKTQGGVGGCALIMPWGGEKAVLTVNWWGSKVGKTKD